MLKKERKFEWTDNINNALLAVKHALGEPGFLMHFDSSLPVTVACDASPVGVGAVLSRIIPDGEEIPTQFASRSLTRSEKKYSHIKREVLESFFGVKRSYSFLFGRKFTLVTDSKSLAAIISPIYIERTYQR